MLGFTAAILFGAALGLRLRMMPFLTVMAGVSLAAGLLRGLDESSVLGGLATSLLASLALQVGYVLGILGRYTLEARALPRPAALRGER